MAEQQWTSATDSWNDHSRSSSNTGKVPGMGNIREFLSFAYWKWPLDGKLQTKERDGSWPREGESWGKDHDSNFCMKPYSRVLSIGGTRDKGEQRAVADDGFPLKMALVRHPFYHMGVS